MEKHLIVTIVENGNSSRIVTKAKEAGAKGATIFQGKGTANTNVKGFLNFSVDPEKEIILICTEGELTQKIYDVIVQAGKINHPGRGIVMILPVMQCAGSNYVSAGEL